MFAAGGEDMVCCGACDCCGGYWHCGSCDDSGGEISMIIVVWGVLCSDDLEMEFAYMVGVWRREVRRLWREGHEEKIMPMDNANVPSQIVFISMFRPVGHVALTVPQKLVTSQRLV